MSADYFAPGDWNFRCEVCGRKRKASESRLRWDKARVCRECFEPRHPQDFVRNVHDDQSVPWTRPDSEIFIEDNGEPTTTVTPPTENGVVGNTVVLGQVDPNSLIASL